MRFFKYILSVRVTYLSAAMFAMLAISAANADDWMEDYRFNDQRGLPYYGSCGIPAHGYGYFNRWGKHNCTGPRVTYTYELPEYYVRYHDYDYDDVKIMGMDLEDYHEKRIKRGYRSKDPIPKVVYAPAPVHAYPAPGVLQRNEPPIIYNNGPVSAYNEPPRAVYTRDDYSTSLNWVP